MAGNVERDGFSSATAAKELLHGVGHGTIFTHHVLHGGAVAKQGFHGLHLFLLFGAHFHAQVAHEFGHHLAHVGKLVIGSFMIPAGAVYGLTINFPPNGFPFALLAIGSLIRQTDVINRVLYVPPIIGHFVTTFKAG